MKQGLKEWIKKVAEDKNFAKKFEGKNAKEVSRIAKEEGYEFTPEEYMDLQMEAAAGGNFDDWWNKAEDFVNNASDKAVKVAKVVGKTAEFANTMSDRKLTGLELYNGLTKIKNKADSNS